MNPKQETENILKTVVAALNAETKIHTSLEYVSILTDGTCDVGMRTLDLVPEYYSSDNDADLETYLFETFKRVLSETTPKLTTINSIGGGEKGHWGCHAKLHGIKVDAKKITTLKSTINKNETKLSVLYNDIKERILNQKSEYKGCPSCGSKVNKKFFKSHRCPVCSQEILTDTDKKKIDKLKQSVTLCREELREIS